MKSESQALRKAYIEDKLSTTKIADLSHELFGQKMSPGKIYSLLKKYEIPIRSISQSVSRAKSLMDPDQTFMTEKMLEWVDGFNLGDGYIGFRKKDYMGARFIIGSTTRAWTSYAMSGLHAYRPSEPSQCGEPCSKRPNVTWSSATLTHPDIVKQARRWYPKGKKIVPSDVRITPTSLLLWYLGDGSIHEDIKRNIVLLRLATCSFSASDIDKILVPKLKEKGFDCAREKQKNDIRIKSHSISKFFDFIGTEPPFQEYAHKFKMPKWLGLLRLSQIFSNRKERYRASYYLKTQQVGYTKSPGGGMILLTPQQADDLKFLVYGGKVPLDDVVKTSQERWNARWFSSNGEIEIKNGFIRGDDSRKLRRMLDDFGETWAVPKDEVNRIFSQAHTEGFPYYSFNHDQMVKKWERLQAADKTCSWNGLATELANVFHPQMFECRRRGKMSPVEFFQSDDDLKRGIKKVLSLHGKSSRSKLRDICRNESASSRVSNFPPLVAKSIMMEASERLRSSKLSILDPCAGFSGRMIGCAASGVASRYVGIDWSCKTAQGLRSTVAFLRTVSPGANLEVIEGNCLDILPALKQFDVILTSPPFLDVEEYAGVPFERDYGKWIETFIRPFIRLCAARLRPRGMAFFYLEKIRGRDFPGDFSMIASKEGLPEKDPLEFIMSQGEYRRPGGTTRRAKVLVLRKETGAADERP